ncbi:MAG: hypothetical protein ACR2KU_08155 [Gammaproteobacteria bacterium]
MSIFRVDYHGVTQLTRARKRRFIQVQPVKRIMLVFAGPAGVPIAGGKSARVRQSRLIATENATLNSVKFAHEFFY